MRTWWPLEGSCEHVNETSGYIKCFEILEQLNTDTCQKGLSSIKLVNMSAQKPKSSVHKRHSCNDRIVGVANITFSSVRTLKPSSIFKYMLYLRLRFYFPNRLFLSNFSAEILKLKSIGQPVLVSGSHLKLMSRFFSVLPIVDLFMCDVLSNERTNL
jgi:hypothetical protein